MLTPQKTIAKKAVRRSKKLLRSRKAPGFDAENGRGLILMQVPIKMLVRFRTAEEFLSAIRPANSLWDGDDDAHTGWIFRGQASADWPLRPSIYRPGIQLTETYFRTYKRRYRYSPDEWQSWVKPKQKPSNTPPEQWSCRLSSAAFDALVHALLIRDFVLIADRAGQGNGVPEFLWHLENRSEHEDALGKFFRGEVEHRDLAVFAIAQHHTVPTGLLDWTYNPLVAAFFAAEARAVAGDSAPGGYIAVWAIRTQIFRHNIRELRRLTVPPGRVPFLDAQNGLFTWCPDAYESFLVEGHYPTVEHLVKRIAVGSIAAELSMPLLRKLVLPAREVSALLKLLWKEQVTRAHLMPTYDNVAKSMHLRATWSSVDLKSF